MNDSPESKEDLNEQILLRKSKLNDLRKTAKNAYPNHFRPQHIASSLHEQYDEQSAESLEAEHIQVNLAGRMMTRRMMGKASFVDLQDRSGRIQLYIRKDAVGDEVFEMFEKWDLGDIIGVEGSVFKTKTGELSVKVARLELITKSLRPLPDKWHGLTDQELRYRQRYLDLMVNPLVKRTFIIRSKLIQAIRQYLVERDFIEVETPMMQVIPGGAAAKPFITHHNALNRDLYLRIAPELYLKRLVVGGFERVFEINRNFRNEGLSTRHNPEFTMLEFYQSYADYNDFMDVTENLIRVVVEQVLGNTVVNYQGVELDFSKPFDRLTIKEALVKYHPELKGSLEDKHQLSELLAKQGVKTSNTDSISVLQLKLFEQITESLIVQPTFITAYPREASPLARASDIHPELTDRAELYIGGREIANMFSELNDPEDQADRFQKQAQKKAAGDEEAMHYDADYVLALEYGLAPCAGCGVGIDRLAMLLTDSPSIRDVILFPHMRPS